VRGRADAGLRSACLSSVCFGKGFAGNDVNTAKYYPEDKDYLLEFEPHVVHYEVVGIG